MVNGQPPPPAPKDADDAAAAADSIPPPPSPAVQAPDLVVDSTVAAAAAAAAVSPRPPRSVPLVVEGIIPEEPFNDDVIQPVQEQQQQQQAAAKVESPPSPKRRQQSQQQQRQQKQKQLKPQDWQTDRPMSLNLHHRLMSMNSSSSLNMDAMDESWEDHHHHHHHHDNHSSKLKHTSNVVSDLSYAAVVSQSAVSTTTTTTAAAAATLVPLSPALEKEEQVEGKPIASLSTSLAPPPLPPPPPSTVTVPVYSMQQQQHQQQYSESRIRLGICAMDKKARSRPMTQILSRLDDLLFEVVFFGDDLILNHDITEWPICDVVIAFFSKGYPLAKAKEYVALRQPFILNDLENQELLQDRRRVYDLLEASGIDVPRHVYLSRDGYVSTGTGDGNGAGDTEVQEFDDHIIINGMQIHKPFVEKPVNAEDHNIAIYYPTTAGGGCKKLFRKIGNRSSEFYPNINEVRRDGSYIYEEFVETQGTDVKMYTVGPEYGHAEARKSPTIDGKVERNSDGKEVRFPVILTFREKEIARRIVLVFQQFVCGFDILRVQEGHAVVSYVCDVNGWSFVKNSRKYYDDCAQILSEHILALAKPSPNPTFSTLDPLVTIANMSLHQLPEEGGTVGENGDDETISDGASIIDGPTAGYYPMTATTSAAASVGSATNNNNNTRSTSPLVGRGGRKNTFLTRATRMLQGECVSCDDDDDDDPEYYDRDLGEQDVAMVDGGRSGGGGDNDKSFDGLIQGELSQHAPQQQQSLAIFTTHHARSPSRCPETGELLSNAAATLVEGAVPVREFPNNLMSEPASLAQSSNSSYADIAGYEYNDEDVGDDGDENAQRGLFDLEEDRDETGKEKGDGAAKAMTGGKAVVGGASRTEKKTTERSKAHHNQHHKTSSSSERVSSGRRRRSSNLMATHQEELRCVLAIIRHGDRTPKQKLKVNMTEPHILKYFYDHSKGAADKDLKVKAKQPMTEFLETVKTTLYELKVQTDSSNSTSDAVASIKSKDKKKNTAIKAAAGVAKKGADQGNLRHQLMHMRDILERWKIAGLNRKLQIKPKKFEEYVDETTGEVKRHCTQVQLILKWGGNLTKLGEKQAINLGHKHRRDMYPDAPGGGILRLHSTFRHDLKIKTSDEGRVMKTAAAFAKGLLELEGDLPPILVSLVHKEKGSMHMLDPSGNKEVKMELDECKEKITANLQRDIEIEQASEDDLYQLVGPKDLTSLRSAIQEVRNPRKTLVKIHQIMGKLINQLEEMLDEMGSGDERRIEGGEGLRGQDEFDVALSGVKLYKGETLLELTERWRFIYDRLYDAETDQFDLSRIPDVHDNVRFDVLHNPHLGLSGTFETLYQLAKPMADCVVPQEYGTTVAEKRSVGVRICHGLLEKIKYDLSVARTDNEVDMRYMINMAYSADLPINTMGRRIRTRLYFTSESHLHTVLSVFRFAGQSEQNSTIDGKKRRKRHKHPLLSERGMSIINGTPELCYLTQIVMRVFEDNRRAMDDPCRFRVEILFSPGATATPRVMDEKEREQDTSRFDTAPLQVIGREGLTCQEVEDFFEQAIMAGRTDEDTPYDVASTVAMPESPLYHQAAMPSKDVKAAADDAQGQQNAKALSTAETGSETALQKDADKPLGKDETSGGRDIEGKNDNATSACSENESTLTRSNRASMGRALLKERMELDTKSVAAMEEKEATDVSQTQSLCPSKDDDDDQEKNKEDNTKDSTSSNDELSTTRKYFWGTVAVASFGLGAACLFMALTFPMDRRGYRRWATTRGRY